MRPVFFAIPSRTLFEMRWDGSPVAYANHACVRYS